ncbi:MAG: hypothetical protein AAFW84_20935 [Cyanobacteria bacterium J06635_15]
MLFKYQLFSVALGTCAIAGFSAFNASSSQAATVLTGFQTTGADMGGMEVTVNFLGGLSETAIWQPTGGLSGGAFATEWSLTQSGNTFNGFNNPWVFNYDGFERITSLIIDAVPGNTVFDILPVALGTPGSADGGAFTVTGGQAPTTFDYSVPIDISVGDLFGQLTLDWDSGFEAGSLAFLADTDSGTIDNPVTPDPDPVDPDPIDPDPVDPTPVSVPEPGLLLGLLGLGALGINKQLQQRGKVV